MSTEPVERRGSGGTRHCLELDTKPQSRHHFGCEPRHRSSL
jgi:hypothetical protein